jgi:phage-related protein
MPHKRLVFLGTSRRDLRAFSALVRRLTGFELRRVQQGLEPTDWKPMPAVGPGVREIRLHAEGAHRVFYLTTRAEAVYVLHAFQKKTQKTAARDINIGRQRYQDLAQVRKQHDQEKRR